MTSFKLTKDTVTYELFPTGVVKKGDAAFGSWSTDTGNHIAVKPSAGGNPITFDVGWKFDENNHLCLSSGGDTLFDFNNTPERPLFSTNNSVIKVRPDRNNTFSFELRGEWDLEG